MQHKSSKSGFARIQAAFFHSLRGLKHATTNEAAFRQELVLFGLLLIPALLLPVEPLVRLLLIGTNTLVLIVELLNSAVESVVDLASPDYHELAKNAKDLASSAVFLSLLLALAVWLTILVRYVF